jgi:GAF domain
MGGRGRPEQTPPVPTRQREAAVQRELLRLGSVGPDLAALQHGLLRVLRRLLPVDAAFLATADPGTLLFTGAASEEPLREASALFLDNELAGADVNRFPALAAAAPHVASLDDATRRDRFASPRYRDLMRPLGLGDELRAALVSGADCWGYLCLHRADGAGGFAAEEVAVVERLVPHLAHALRGAMPHAAAAPGGAPGVVVLTDRFEVVAVTPEAADLLARVAGAPWPPAGLPWPSRRWRRRCGRASAGPPGRCGRPPRGCRCARAAGWSCTRPGCRGRPAPTGSPSSSSRPGRPTPCRCCWPRTG